LTGASRFRAKTGGGFFSAASLAAVHATTVVSSQSSWRGDFLWATQQLGSGLYLVVPVMLAAVCLPSVLRGGGGSEAALLPTRPRVARLRRWATDAAPIVACHLAFVVWALTVTTRHGTALNVSALVTVAIQLAVIAFAAALGRALGEATDHVAAAVAAAILGSVLLVYGEGVIRVSAGDSPYAGLRLDLGPYRIALTVIALCVLVLLVVPDAARLRMGSVALVAVVTLAFGMVLDEPTLSPTTDTPTECDQVEGVPVCVYAGYRFILPQLSQQARESLRTFNAHGIDPHIVEIVQGGPGRVEPPGTISVAIDRGSLQTGRLNPFAVPSSVLHPVWCPRIHDPRQGPPQAFDLAQRRAFEWLQRRRSVATEAEFQWAVPAFAKLSAAEQDRKIQEFLDANIECRGLT